MEDSNIMSEGNTPGIRAYGAESFPKLNHPLDVVAIEYRDPSIEPSPPRSVKMRGICAQFVPFGPQECYNFAWLGKTHYLGLYDIRLQDGETFADDGKARHLKDLRGTMTFIPPGGRIWGWSLTAPGKHSLTALYVDEHQFEEETAARFQSANRRPHIYFADERLHSSMAKLQAALSAAEDPDALYLETLCLLVSLELGRFQSQDAERVAQPAGGLARAHEQRIIEFVDANLNADIGLADLAGVIGLSRFHFVRSFKKTTGVAPYQYLLRRRIERARVLLRQGGTSIGEIALAVGFNSAARFNRAFRRICGTTPSAYRGMKF
jgi:AraC family transcriptional regulator